MNNFISLRTICQSFDRTSATIYLNDNTLRPTNLSDCADLIMAYRFTKQLAEAELIVNNISEYTRDEITMPLHCEIAFLYIAQKRLDLAEEYLLRNYVDHAHLNKLLALIKFLKIAADFKLEESNSFNFVTKDEFAIHLRDISRSRTPNHVVRLGDGEALFWGALNFPGKEKFDSYTNFVAEEQYRVWFGKELKQESLEQVNFLSNSLFESYKTSVFIGCNDYRRYPEIYDSYAFSPYRNYFPGYFGFISTYHLLVALSKFGNLKLFEAFIFLELLNKDFINELLNDGLRLSFISCHDLSNEFVSPVESILIPGAKGEAIPEHLKLGNHYPDRFNEIMMFLSSADNVSGKIFIIGAGILAKIYADKIHKMGGIAFDVGSSIDYMMGFESRKVYK